MTAAALVQDLRTRGFKLQAADGRLVVTPASRLTDADRELIKRHRDELLALANPANAANGLDSQGLGAGERLANDGELHVDQPDAAPRRTCGDCAHLSRAGTCQRPVQAGLAERHGIRWPEPEHATRCPAFEERQRPEEGQHPYEAERRAWTPATARELTLMQRRFDLARQWGLARREADRLADVLHWRDRTGDDRRLCLECLHLRAGIASRWYCARLRDSLPQQLVTDCPHRCPHFELPRGHL